MKNRKQVYFLQPHYMASWASLFYSSRMTKTLLVDFIDRNEGNSLCVCMREGMHGCVLFYRSDSQISLPFITDHNVHPSLPFGFKFFKYIIILSFWKAFSWSLLISWIPLDNCICPPVVCQPYMSCPAELEAVNWHAGWNV